MELNILAIVMLVIGLVATGYGCLDNEAANLDEKSATGMPDTTNDLKTEDVNSDEKPAAGISNPTGSSRINITPLSYDFEDIGFDLASHDFVVTNTGDAVLKISKLSTNCGCTTAEIDIYEVYPGDEAILNVTFDPQHHMSTGNFLREAFVASNDPKNPVATVEIRMRVVGEPPVSGDVHQPQ